MALQTHFNWLRCLHFFFFFNKNRYQIKKHCSIFRTGPRMGSPSADVYEGISAFLPHQPLSWPLSQCLGEDLTSPRESHVCQCRNMEPGLVSWVSQSTFIGLMQSQPLPASWAFYSRLPGALRSMPVLSQGHLYAQRFPSSHVLRPFTLYPWTQQTVLEPICVCKHLRDLGPSLNILHISTNRFPSAPVGRIPLLWPLKPLGSLYLLLYIQLLSLVMSEDNC